MHLPVRADGIGDRRHPAGVFAIVLDHLHRDLRRARAPGIDHVLDRGGGGGRILRIQRQHHDALDAACTQAVQRLAQGRRAVAHGPGDVPVGHDLLQAFGQAPRVHRQWRAVRQPHLGVFFCRLGAADGQDHAIQQRLPEQRRDGDHAAVAEKFGQVAAHGRGSGRLGSAEVDHQQGGVGSGVHGDHSGRAWRACRMHRSDHCDRARLNPIALTTDSLPRD